MKFAPAVCARPPFRWLRHVETTAWLCLVLGSALAEDTNKVRVVPVREFQGFKVGSFVRARATKPMVDVKGLLFSITASNVTVVTRSERFTLPTNTLVLLPASPPAQAVAPALGLAPAKPATGGVAAASPPAATALPITGDIQAQVAAIGQGVLGKYSQDPGYQAATDRYQKTMQGVLSGQTQLPDLVRQAKEVLAQVDKFGPERQKDPQFEPYIELLKDFVRRAEAGESIQTPATP